MYLVGRHFHNSGKEYYKILVIFYLKKVFVAYLCLWMCVVCVINLQINTISVVNQKRIRHGMQIIVNLNWKKLCLGIAKSVLNKNCIVNRKK